MQRKQHHRQNLMIFAALSVVTALVFCIFTLAGISGGRGELLMPLDDVYIHFQYAKQIANGQPYIYNPGDPPTSGATSFIYPWLLALGYWLGFTGLNLGWWALLLGAVALLISLNALYWLCLALGLPRSLSLFTALVFGLTGTFAWHFMSGMETGLMVAFTLLTLLMVVQRNLWGFALAGSLLAITRPEGSIMAAIASLLMLPRLWRHVARRWYLLVVFLPVVAIFAQPALNYLITGTVVASGSQAKSVFGSIPFDLGAVVSRIIRQFSRMWLEFITGYSPLQGWYLPPLSGLLGVLGAVLLLFRREWRSVGLALLGWFVVVSGAISTLDTTFWHFKRYQVPLMALFLPLAVYAIFTIVRFVQRRDAIISIRTNEQISIQRVPAIYKTNISKAHTYTIIIAIMLSVAFLLPLFAQFVHYHAANVGYVQAQPLQMARWLAANTPEDATVAVHDVGVMRYIGERRTLDIVGLTTASAAQYWRNGPGAVAEFIMREQPDYIASYGRGHGYGLGMLADTDLYANQLAGFPVDIEPHLNVALAAAFQAIYQPDFLTEMPEATYATDKLANEYFVVTQQDWWRTLDPKPPQRTINVADPASEARVGYTWDGYVGGNATSVYEWRYPVALIPDVIGSYEWPVLDAVRRLDGFEEFTISHLDPTYGLLLTTRLHSIAAGELRVFANGALVDESIVIQQPGFWQDVRTWIPPAHIDETTTIRVEADISGDQPYEPARHALLQMRLEPPAREAAPIATYQDEALQLLSVDQTLQGEAVQFPNRLWLELGWYSEGNASGDYRFFAHLYDDVNQAPVAQVDRYLDWGNVPVGNLLHGILSERFTIFTSGLPPGVYQLAIGFYNPQTNERLMPESNVYEISPDGRLFLGEVVIPSIE